MPNAEEIKISQTSQTTVATALSSLSSQLKSKADLGEVYTKDEVDEITDELYLDIKQDLKKDYTKKLSSKQNAEEGKGLSTNDFTDELKSKLLNLKQGLDGEKGEKGDAGLSAYDLAVQKGYIGTLTEWLNSLKGEAGQRGETGETGKAGRDGKDGLNGRNGSDGADGKDGLSAYQVALQNGFKGTQTQWLASLRGPAGSSGGTGLPGASAYQIAVRNGFKGSGSEWLDSLQGSGGGTSDYTKLRNLPDLSKYALADETFDKEEVNELIRELETRLNNLPSPDLSSITDELNSLKTQIQNKVNAETGMGLSQNNFTNELKAKLESLTSGVAVQSTQYIHIQETPLEIWEIEHNLDKYPSVTVIDSAQTEVEGEITHISKMKVKIQFSSPFSGKAILQ